MKDIKTVTIIGANGTMGSNVAGIIGGFGQCRIFMVARDMEKAQEGCIRAAISIRSYTLLNNLVPKTYDALPECIKESDWVFEMVGEDFSLKYNFNCEIAKHRREGTIVSTITSGLSVVELSRAFNTEGQSLYFGIHFFNPPYKMILCELISHEANSIEMKHLIRNFLEKKLHRVVVEVKDSPAFIGNRIAFQFINKAAQLIDSDGVPVSWVDNVLGRFTGRSMPPLSLIDFVGLDVHKAIVDNVYEKTEDYAHYDFICPKYISDFVKKRKLGVKTGEGLYKTEKSRTGKRIKYEFDFNSQEYVPVKKYDFHFSKLMKDEIRVSNYEKAFGVLFGDNSTEALVCQKFIINYITYSYSLVNKCVDSKDDIDIVMATGLFWAPPSVLVDFIGGIKKVRSHCDRFDMVVPEFMKGIDKDIKLFSSKNLIDPRKYFLAY